MTTCNSRRRRWPLPTSNTNARLQVRAFGEADIHTLPYHEEDAMSSIPSKHRPFYQVTKADEDTLTEACDRKRLATTRSVYFALVRLANDNRHHGPTFAVACKDLAARAGVGTTALNDAVKTLCAAGLLVVEGGRSGVPNRWTLLSVGEAEGDRSAVTSDPEGDRSTVTLSAEGDRSAASTRAQVTRCTAKEELLKENNYADTANAVPLEDQVENDSTASPSLDVYVDFYGDPRCRQHDLVLASTTSSCPFCADEARHLKVVAA